MVTFAESCRELKIRLNIQESKFNLIDTKGRKLRKGLKRKILIATYNERLARAKDEVRFIEMILNSLYPSLNNKDIRYQISSRIASLEDGIAILEGVE